MAQYSIRGKRILKVSLPKEFDINTIQIGVPVMDDEAKKVGLKREGDIVLPSAKFGIQSKKNAYFNLLETTVRLLLRLICTEIAIPKYVYLPMK